MRQLTLMNLVSTQLGTKNGIRSDIQNYMRNGCITSPVKSLDLLRRNLQAAINKDIDNVIKKYLEVCQCFWFCNFKFIFKNNFRNFFNRPLIT